MKVFAVSRNGKMLKLGNDDKSAKWYFLSNKVVDFVKGNIKVGEEVSIQYDENGGKYTINYITKGKEEPKQTIKSEPQYKCKECGTPLKDGKYEKCYECNKKELQITNNLTKSTSTNESIKRQAIGHMTSRTLSALQGPINPDNEEIIVEKIYKKFQKLVC